MDEQGGTRQASKLRSKHLGETSVSRRPIELEHLVEEATQRNSTLLAMKDMLNTWIGGAHRPSEGAYLEHIVRTQLRQRMPRGYEVSTGFISAIERAEGGGLERIVSRQHDIVIWNSLSYSPLFRADDFVVVMPESVAAVIEVTRELSSKKLREDLEKFDELWCMYGGERMHFKPFLGIVGFGAKRGLAEILQDLERWYLFDAELPIQYRYEFMRQDPSKGRRTIPAFVEAICVVDKGIIRGSAERTAHLPRNGAQVVHYTSYPHRKEIADAFGLFERDLLFTIADIVKALTLKPEPSVDTWREFLWGTEGRGVEILMIEDCMDMLHGVNVLYPDGIGFDTLRIRNKLTNVSLFRAWDFTQIPPTSECYIEGDGGSGWAFERHDEGRLIASGKYRNNQRDGKWRVWVINRKGQCFSFWIKSQKNGNWRKLDKSPESSYFIPMTFFELLRFLRKTIDGTLSPQILKSDSDALAVCPESSTGEDD